MGKLLGWLKIEDNREAALALLTVVTALLGGGWFLYDRLFPSPEGGAVLSLEVGGSAGQVQQAGAGGIAVVAGAGAVVTVNDGPG